MKNILFILFLSLFYANDSYSSLLLPNSTDQLLSEKFGYSISHNILFNKKINSFFSSSFINLPQSIQITSLQYCNNILKDYYNHLAINIINYGDFEDSELNYHFSAKDIIIKNNIFKTINQSSHFSLGINYINSNIENYSSSAIAMQLQFYYHYKNFLFNSSINNYGIVINNYTNYNETLPRYYGLSVMYLPRYLDSSLFFQYRSFNDFHIINVLYELFIINNYSISLGYTSLAKKLYFDDFSNNFFTGVSLGFSMKYKKYFFNIGVKNLGALGLVQSITFNRSFN